MYCTYTRTCIQFVHVHYMYMYSVHVICSSSSHSPSLPQLECCGVNSSSNWEVNPNVMTYPDSCCPGSFNTSADPPCPEPFADVRACFFVGWVFGGGGGGGLCMYMYIK